MTRISDLIAQLAPSGVPQLALGEVVVNLDSKRRPVTRSERRGGGYPYYGANGVQDYVEGYIFDGTFLLIGEDGSVMKSDGSPVLNWATGKIWVNNHAHVVGTKSDELDLRYLFHYLHTVDISSYVTGGSQLKLNQGNLNRIPVPIPPIHVQREIVRILDHFTELEAELETELEAELETRRRQYSHYRDSLLAFPNRTGLRWAPMGEVGGFVRGRRFVKNDYVADGIPSIHYGEIYTTYGAFTRATVSTVRRDLAPQLRYADTNDVVIAGVGETVADVGKSVAWLGDHPVAIHDDCFAFRSAEDPLYIVYVMQTPSFQLQKESFVASAKVKRLSGASMAMISIPVPPIEEQQRIVAILDQFSALVNDISIGLPAELAARRKQYSYYRDRLLTFKEAAK